jgi:hypothetical protein
MNANRIAYLLVASFGWETLSFILRFEQLESILGNILLKGIVGSRRHQVTSLRDFMDANKS